MIPPCLPTPAQMERFWSKVYKGDGCWLWTGRLSGGYGVFDYGGGSQLSHRISLATTAGRWPEQCVLHACDNKRCVNPKHLSEGTHADNNRDRAAKGRSAKRRPNKLTLDGLWEVYRQRRRGRTLESVASEFGVSVSFVSKLALGRMSRHVG